MTDAFQIYRTQVLKWLVAHAYQHRERPFGLRSGATSHHYVDVRPLLLAPSYQRMIAHVAALTAAEAGLEFDGVAGVPLGGLLLADAVAFELSIPMAVPRETAKDHGTGRRVERGLGLKDGHRLLLLEDVVTSGGSAREAAEALRTNGFIITDAIAVVDRRTPNEPDMFAAAGIKLRGLYTLAEIISAAGIS